MTAINNNNEKTSFVQTEYGTAIIEKGVLIVDYSPNTTIDIDTAKKMVASRLALMPNYCGPIIVHSLNMKNITDSARDYLASKEALVNITKLAIISTNRFHSILGKFYILFSKPTIPTEIFSTFDDAYEWAIELDSK